MNKYVRPEKKQRLIDELILRIESGQMAGGFHLPVEGRLADEFGVSHSTLRQALAELKRRKLIARLSHAGSIVTADGIALDGRNGWGQALAENGGLMNTELLRLEAVSRPDLFSRYGTESFIALDRRRRLTDGTLVSLERSLVPATGDLEGLPRVGLIDDSLTITMAAYGYIAERGDQWISAEALSEEDAILLGRRAGSVFLKTLRVSYDRAGRFMEQIEGLLDPLHFRMHQVFGDQTDQ